MFSRNGNRSVMQGYGRDFVDESYYLREMRLMPLCNPQGGEVLAASPPKGEDGAVEKELQRQEMRERLRIERIVQRRGR